MIDGEESEAGADLRWFDALAASSTIGIFRSDLDRGVEWVNDRFVEITGRRHEEILGRGWFDGVHPHDADRVDAALTLSREHPQTIELEYRFVRPDGSIRWVRVRAAPIVIDEVVRGYAGGLEDITEVIDAAEEAARLVAVCQTTSDFIAVTDAAGNIRYLNPAARALGGFPVEGPLPPLTPEDLYAPESFPIVQSDMLLALMRDRHWKGELGLLAADGSTVPVSQVATLERDGDGEVAHVALVARDLRHERQLAAEARRSDAQFRLLAEASPFGIVEFDAEGRVAFVNRRFAEISGRTREQLVEQLPTGEVLHPDDRERVLGEMAEAFRQRQPVGDLEHRLVRPDGDVVWARARTSAVFADDGRFLGYLATVEDISQEMVDRADIDRLLGMLDATPDYASIVDEHGRVLFLNPAASELLGVAPDEDLSGVDYRRFYTEPSLEVLDRDTRRAIEERGVWAGELMLVSHDGREIPIWQTTVVSAGNNGAAWYASISHDISTLKEAEARVQRSEAWFRTLLQNLTDLVVVQAQDGRLRYVSPSIEQVLGYTADEILSETEPITWAAIHPEDRDAVEAAGRLVRSEPGGTARIELRARHKDGGWRWLDTTMHNLLDDLSVRGVVVNATDVTEERRARDAQARSEAVLRAVVLQSPLAIYAVDPEGITRLWNHRAEELFGYSADEVLGRGLPFVRDDELDRFDEHRARVVAGETIRGIEIERVRKDGTPITVSLSAAPVRDHEGTVVTIMGVIADITDRKRAEQALRQSEERFRALVTHASDIVIVYDADGRVTYASPSAGRFGGYDPDDAVGTTLEILHPDDQDAVHRMVVDLVADGGTSTPIEARIRHHSGEWRWIEIVATNLLDDPAVGGIVTNARDVTERVVAAKALHAANEALRQSNETLGAVVENSPFAIYAFDPDGVVLFWNPACEAIFGFGAEEAIGRVSPVVRPVDEQASAEVCRRVVAGEVIQPTEARRRHKDGHEIDVMFAAAPMRDEHGDVVAVLALSSDVTSVKEQERALLENEARFQALAEHASVIITIREPDGTCRYTSPSAARILGRRDEPGGSPMNVFDEVHPEDRDRMREFFQRTLESSGTNEVVRFRIRHANGSWRDLEAVGNNLLDDPGVRGLLITARDVTEQAAVERALRESEERFRALVQNLSDVVTIVNEDGTVRWTSPAIERVFGFTAAEATARDPFSLIHPDDHAHVVETVSAQLERPGPHEPFTFRAQHADGSWRYVEALVDDLRENPAIGALVLTSRDVTESREAEARLAASEARYRGIVEDQTELICRYNSDGAVTFVNEAYARYFGLSVDELEGEPHVPFIPEDDRERVIDAIRSLGPDTPSVTLEHRMVRPDGALRWHEWTHRVVLDGRGEVVGYGALGRDITEQREAEALVADQARILEMIARGAPLEDTFTELCEVVEAHAPDVVCSVSVVHDANADVLCTGAAPSLPEGFVHALDGLRIGPRSASCGTAAHLGEAVVVTDVATDPLWEEFRELAMSHGIRSAWSSPITTSAEGRVLGTLCLYSREPASPSRRHEQLVEMVVHHAAIAIERKRFEAQLAHQAHHDPLTRLPNRVLFMEFLVLALARARRYRSTIAVLFLDLDRFKVVNDSLGHDAGDKLLVALGERLRSVIRPGDTVARFGGDEFTILCEDLSGPQATQQAVEVAERLLDVIHQPFLLEGDEHFLSASIGIALARSGDDPPDALLRDADAAMYQAKERGKGRWALFDDTMRQSALQRLEIENALHRAIDRGEFRVFYQPCMSIREGRCVGAEALVRWQHPERGLVAPMEFIGLAEETGLVVPLGRWVIDEACRQAARWHAERADPDGFQVSVNLSGRQLAHSELVDQVAAAIEATGIDPSWLSLEITESVLMDDVDATTATLRRLKALGVHLSIDDFGTGYSSLGYLKRFPVDSVKVDRSFVDGLGTDAEDSAIVAAVVSLGHALGLTVVAEGVETEAQLSELVALGCDQAQGYLFSPPMAALDVHEAMTRPRRWSPESRLA